MNSSSTDHGAYEIDNRDEYRMRLWQSARLHHLSPAQLEREGTARILERARWETKCANGVWKSNADGLNRRYSLAWAVGMLPWVIGAATVLYMLADGLQSALQTLSR